MAGLTRMRWVAAALSFVVAGGILTASAAVGQEARVVPLTVNRTAYFTHEINGALPPVLVEEVPPGPVCVVRPEACGPQVAALKSALGLNSGLPLPEVPDYALEQPVPPGELPVGMMGGATRYTSALRFDLPRIEPNSIVNRFDLIIPEGALAFSIESPAFRQAVLSVLQQYPGYPNPNKEAFEKLIADVSSMNTPLFGFAPTGIEVCLASETWEEGESQHSAAAPKADCIVGGTGKHDDAAGIWTFDISGIAQAWADGAANNGVTFAPLGAQNVAYGDPDPSTNFTLTLDPRDAASGLKARVNVSPPVEELAFDLDPVGGDDTSLDVAPSLDLDASPFTSSSSGLAPPVETGAANPGRVRLARSNPSTPWWVWLIVPMVLGGCWAMSEAVAAVPDLATRRAGALSRLTATHEARNHQ